MSAIELKAVSYDKAGAAAATGFSPKTLEAAVRSGDLIAHYVGRKPVFRALDLDEWVASLPTESTSRAAS